MERRGRNTVERGHRVVLVFGGALALGGLSGCAPGVEGPGRVPGAHASAAYEVARSALGVCGEPLCFAASDTLLNTSVAGAQDSVAVAAAPDGTALVVFRDRSGQANDAANGDAIRARFFDPNGLPLGPDIVVETTTTKIQQTPTVAASTDGVFLVAWADNRGGAPDATGYAIRARRFDTTGQALDAEDFVVNSTTTGDQLAPVAAATPDGAFLVAWRDTSRRAPDTSSGAIRARRLGADGLPLGAEIVVNSTTLNDQSEPALAVAPDGGWAVAFTDASLQGGDASGTQVRWRRFGPDDLPLGPDERVNLRTDRDQRQPDLAFGADGGVWIVYTDYGPVGDAAGYEVRGRAFGADATPLGDELALAADAVRNQTQPVVAWLPGEGGGRFLAAFTDDARVAPDLSGTTVRARLLRPDGSAESAPQVVVDTTNGSQSAPALPARTTANLLIAWTDGSLASPDTASTGIRGRLLRLARCGDGRLDAESGEQCDDGAREPGDGCSERCTLEACGDGVVQPGEGCDDGDGNALQGDCLPDCQPARCGDGVVQAGRGEVCDDGNLLAGDGCDATCRLEAPSRDACLWLCRATSSADGCNGVDDDCDGLVDEDGDLGHDAAHCGDCASEPCPATTPYRFTLAAPAGATAWEPSGAAVDGDTLWVANDKDGRVAAYALPLSPGVNAPLRAFTVRPNGVTPKWEALRREADGHFLLLNANDRLVWRCDPAVDCAGPVSVPVGPGTAALGAVRLESVAVVGEHLWMGSRETPSKMADETGRLVSLGSMSPDGRAYKLSDAVYVDDRFYLTWSYEGAGSTQADVAGFLAVARPDAAGRPDPATLRICTMLPGKPEGLDAWGASLVVVFDQDGARKRPGDATAFDLTATRDFATVIPRAVCP